MRTPLVSIVIPVYNGANYLEQAIESAMAQSYSNIEILVINDGSTDDGATAAIAARYKNDIRYFEKENGGVSSALNLGIHQMRGKYFSWLSHDDLYAVEKIERQVADLEAQPSPSISYTDYIVFSEDIEDGTFHAVSDIATKSPRCFFSIRIGYNGINGCSLLIPKVCFDACGWFDEGKKWTQDYDMWFRIGSAFPFVYTPGAFVYSRSHPDQDTNINPSLNLFLSDELYARHISKLSIEEVDRYYDDYPDLFWSYMWTSKVFGYPLAHKELLSLAQRKLPMLVNQSVPAESLTQKNQQLLNQIKELMLQPAKKPRIAFFAASWMIGGVERALSILIPRLAQDYEVLLITPPKSKKGFFSLPEEIKHIEMDFDWSGAFCSRLATLCLLMNVQVFVGCLNCSVITNELYAHLHQMHIKIVAYNHESFFYPYLSPSSRTIVKARQAAFQYADVVTWLTNANARIGGFYAKNTITMTNPFFDEVGNGNIPRCRSKIVLAVGRFDDGVKRVDRMLRCFAKVLKRVPDAKLVLVGSYNLNLHIPGDSSESIEQMIKALNIPQDSICFVGSSLDTHKYYAQACVLILTSISEGLGLVLLEAAAHGVPSVIQEVPGLEDIIEEGVNGYIVPQDDEDSMAKRVSALLTDKSLREEMSRQAVKMVRRFAPEVIVERWKKLLPLVLLYDDKEELHAAIQEAFPQTRSIDEALVKQTYDIMKRVGAEYHV